jgi:hypothetical protein
VGLPALPGHVASVDRARCPWPWKAGHQTRASAERALRAVLRVEIPGTVRIYLCPCGLLHTGHQRARTIVVSGNPDTPPELLAWHDDRCAWCWGPIVVEYRRGEDPPDESQFCHSGCRSKHEWYQRRTAA